DAQVAGAGLEGDRPLCLPDAYVATAGGDPRMGGVRDGDVAGAGLDPQVAVGAGDVDVPASGVEDRGAGDVRDGDVTGAGARAQRLEGALDDEVGGAQLGDQHRPGRQVDVDDQLGVAAEEPGAYLGCDQAEAVALVGELDLLGVAALDADLGAGGLHGPHADPASADLDVHLDRGGGVERLLHGGSWGVRDRRRGRSVALRWSGGWAGAPDRA